MNGTVQRLDNFLPEVTFNHIQKMLMDVSGQFPYNYRSGLSFPEDRGFIFSNTLFHDYPTPLKNMHPHPMQIIRRDMEPWFNSIAIPLVSRLSMSRLLRVFVNCNPRMSRIDPLMSAFHTDFDSPHLVGIYCVNTCNGYTEFEDNTRLESIANTMYVFDGSLAHRAVMQTDENIRVNINIGFEE